MNAPPPTGNPAASLRLGTGCVVLFALPFAGAGLLLLYQAWREFSAGDAKKAAGFAFIGTVFTLAGVGLAAGGVWAVGHERRREQRRQAHPAEPWRWREDWAGGRVDSQGPAGMVAVWVFAVIWNLISSPVFLMLPRELERGNRAVLVALIFPLFGLGLLALAVHRTLRHRKFGRPVFRLAANPFPLGGEAAGVVEIPVVVRPADGFRVMLACVERLTTGTGKNRSTREKSLWQATALVPLGELPPVPGRTLVPIRFVLPGEAREASREACNPSVHWRLTVSAGLPGVDFQESFELPVFRAAA